MKIYKYGDNVDTDVIIPARYLNAPDEKSLASHCMEDIDKEFIRRVKVPVNCITTTARARITEALSQKVRICRQSRFSLNH